MNRQHLSVILFCLGILIIVVVHIEDYRQTDFLVGSFADVEESQQTLTDISKLASSLKDIQRSHRGYVITQQREFLGPYEQAIVAVPAILKKLNTKTDASEKSHFDSLRILADKKIAYVEEAIIQVNTGKISEAIFGIPYGKKVFDRMMSIIDELEHNESLRSQHLRKQVQQSTTRNKLIVIAGLVSSSALFLVAMIILFRAQQEIKKLSKGLDESNKELRGSNEELTAILEQLEKSSLKISETQKALEYREKQLLLAQKIAKTGSVYWNLSTNQISCTQQFNLIWNLSDTQHHTIDTILNRVHPQDLPALKQKMEKAVQGNTSFQHEFKINIKEKTLYVLAVFEPYLEDGKMNGYLGTVTDVTDQKKAQEELAMSEKRFRSLLDAAPDPLIITASEGKIVLVNRQTEKLFGFNKEELLGKSIDMLIPYNTRNQFSPERFTMIEGPKISSDKMAMSLIGLKKDGAQIPVEITVSPLYSSDGVLVTASIRDVTEKRKAEEKILEANRELEKVNEALRKVNSELNDFSYSISHDLRAPLRAINGYSSLLREDFSSKLDEHGNKALGVIQRNADRMDALINDLLELAKLGTKPVAKQPVDMNQIIEAVMHDKKLKEGTEISITPMEEVYGDASLLRQVWENFISNAIKFSWTTAIPKIEIGYKREESQQVFWVKDNGVGFDPTYTDKLFKVFSRLHAKHEFEGTGAGLAISRKIIEAHGGTISGTGELKKGAVFTFTLPIESSQGT